MIKTWFLAKAWPWIKPNLMEIVNMCVLVIALAIFTHERMIIGRLVVGFWVFVLLIYYTIFKLFKDN